MSIFESKEFSSISVSKSYDEEFDYNSITIGNVDNEQNGSNKICVSSMKGYLRIFQPHFRSNSSDQLLFEKLYDEPILQIDIGNYIIRSNEYQLGILQSKRFFVVEIKNLKGATNLKLCSDNKLKRNGHNFTRGKIGEKTNDFVFIQSIDGAISIYEQDSLINIVTFSEVLFPGQIGFLNRKDSFIISNTAYEIECYGYNNLATLKANTQNSNFNHTWKVNIGELTIQMEIIYNNLNKKQEIVILSETMLNLINENGVLVYQKKLDFEPRTFYVYNITDTKYQTNKFFDLMCMIATSSNHILIYKGITLAWAVKVYETPIYLSFADFQGIKSLIVSLSENGRLNILYLGMEQVKNTQIVQSKQMDQNFLIKESERLNQIIENYSKGIVATPDTTLTINAEVNQKIFYDNEPGDKVFYKDDYGKILRSQVYLEFSYDGIEAENIRINITCPYNVICDDPIFKITSLSKDDGTMKKTLNFRVVSALFPTFTNVDIYATYYIKDKNNEKIFQSTFVSIELPLTLFVRVHPDNKKADASNKITLCTNKNPLELDVIFKDLTEDYIDSDLIKKKKNLITFIYPNRNEVTVIVSKQNGRYRIQSPQMECILFITAQIVRRLNEHFNYQVECFIDDQINFGKYIDYIKTHFQLIQDKKEVHKELEKYSTLYTSIQKSLLNKYQQKNPPKLSSLDYLLKQVFKSITNESQKILDIENQLKICHRDIIIWTELILYLLKLRSRMTEEHYQILKGAFPLDNVSNSENSWEDITVANMGNLILYYFKGSNNLQEIKTNTDLDKWTKYSMTLFKNIISKHGFGEQNNE